MRKPLFRGAKRWMPLVTGMLLSSILLAACGGNTSILDTAGPVAESQEVLFWVILIISTIVFVGVEGMLIYSIVRYREQPNAPTPRQLHGNLKVEVVWTVIPAVILFIVLLFTIRGLFEVATPPQGGKTLEVTAVGHQWWWEFYYPEYKTTTADILYIPEGTTIKVKLYSNNVIHSFWIPQLAGKTDVVPGHNNSLWFKADRQGEFLGICTEYCGAQHANMRFEVRSVGENQFQTWVSTQQQAAVQAAPGSPEEQGQKLFETTCVACHGIVGIGETTVQDPSVACNDPTKPCPIGPNLTHFGSRNWIAGGVAFYDSTTCNPDGDLSNCALAKWLKDPQSLKPDSGMKLPRELTDDEVKALVAYLQSLK